MMSLVYILFFLTTPALLIYLAIKRPMLDKLGIVGLSFGTGMLLSVLLMSINLIPLFSFINPVNPINAIDPINHVDIASAEITANANTWQTVQRNILDVSIALSLPLLIFSLNIKQAIHSARRVLFASLLAVLSVLTVTSIMAICLHQQLTGVWQYAGMAVGAYIGGGVNIAVVQTAIDADTSVFVAMTSYDLLLSSVYVLFVLTFAIPLCQRILPAYRSRSDSDSSSGSHVHSKVADHTNTSISQTPEQPTEQALKASDTESNLSAHADETASSFISIAKLSAQPSNLASLSLAGVIVGISVLLATFAPEAIASTVTIVLISSLSMLASLIPAVNRLSSSYRLGMYLLMVFCFTAGSMLDVNLITQINASLMLFMAVVIFGSFVLHLLLCRLFNIDRDSFLLTSVASIMSLAFVPLITSKLNNRELLVAGLSVATIGYIAGTYLGIVLAYVLKAVFG